MLNPKLIDQLTSGIASALPPGIGQLQADFERSVRAAVSSAVARMNLVTREEFDVQSAVLARTRAKIDELERKVAVLEAKLHNASDAE